MSPPPTQGGRGVGVFVTGAAAAVVAAGLGWRLLDPPISLDPFTSTALVATMLVYGLPLLVMAAGVGLAWAEGAASRLLLLVVTLLTTMMFAPTLARAGADLFGGRYVTPAVVLASYDCDLLDASGQVRQALTCVELAWTRPDGRASRDRYVLGDDQGQPAALEPGACVMAQLWASSDRLVRLRRTAANRCDAAHVGRGRTPAP